MAPPTARQTALQILHTLETQHAYTDVVLRQMLRHSTLERRDRAFVTDCVYGVMRWQAKIDWLLGHVCRRPLETLTPWIRNALRLGRVSMPVDGARAAREPQSMKPWHWHGAIGHQGTARFVNGVLRTLLREHTTYRLPDAATCPADAPGGGVLASSNGWSSAGCNATAGNARRRCARQTIAPLALPCVPIRCASRQTPWPGASSTKVSSTSPRRLWPLMASWCRGLDRLETLPSYAEGLFQVQDQGAMLVAPLCQARPGQRWLDVCAAPGGKTTHLAQLMLDTGQIVALDLQPGRVRLLHHNIRRLRLSSVTALVADATCAPPVHWLCDGILIDAPCSGFGVLRRHPDIKWRKTAADLVALQADPAPVPPCPASVARSPRGISVQCMLERTGRDAPGGTTFSGRACRYAT